MIKPIESVLKPYSPSYAELALLWKGGESFKGKPQARPAPVRVRHLFGRRNAA